MTEQASLTTITICLVVISFVVAVMGFLWIFDFFRIKKKINEMEKSIENLQKYTPILEESYSKYTYNKAVIDIILKKYDKKDIKEVENDAKIMSEIIAETLR